MQHESRRGSDVVTGLMGSSGRPSLTVLPLAVAMAALLMLALVAGTFAGQGNWLVVAVALLTLPAVYLGLNVTALCLVMIVTGLVVAGTLRLYVPQLEIIRWALLPASFGLVAHCLVRNGSAGRDVPAYVWIAIAFIAYGLVNSLGTVSKAETTLLGLKGYFQLWGLIFAFAFLPMDKSVIRIIAWMLLGVALLQLPFVAHQYLVLVPAREGLGSGIIPADVVAGTFGARRFGGGENSVLTAYLIVVTTGIFSLWQLRKLSGFVCLGAAVCLLVPVAVTESKISAFYFIAALWVLISHDLKSNPTRGLLTLASGIVAMGAIVSTFVVFAPQAGVKSIGDLVEYTWSYTVERNLNFDGALSRAGAYRYWYEKHKDASTTRLLFGHGAGVSRYEDQRIRKTLPQYGIDPDYGIGRTGATAVLWDFGIVGFVLVLALFFSAYRQVMRLRVHFLDSPLLMPLLTAAQVAVLVLLISFFDKGYFAFQIGYQTLFALTLGIIAWATHYASEIAANERAGNTTGLPQEPSAQQQSLSTRS